MNPRAKGNRSELKAVKELENDGWITCRVKGSTKWNKSVDFFNLFDIIAKKEEKTFWIQVKTNRKPPLKPFIDFKKDYCSKYENVEIWIWEDRKGFKKIRV